MDVLGGILGAIAPIANIGIGADLAQRNLNWRSLEYETAQTNFNRLLAREDNSVQRRVADLRAAGLSPVLAAGQGANAGSPISTNSSPVNMNPMQDLGAILNTAQVGAQIDNLKAQHDLITAQTDQTKQNTKVQTQDEVKRILEQAEVLSRTAVNNKTIEQIIENMKKISSETYLNLHDLMIGRQSGASTRGTQSQVGGTVNDFMNMLRKATGAQGK